MARKKKFRLKLSYYSKKGEVTTGNSFIIVFLIMLITAAFVLVGGLTPATISSNIHRIQAMITPPPPQNAKNMLQMYTFSGITVAPKPDTPTPTDIPCIPSNGGVGIGTGPGGLAISIKGNNFVDAAGKPVRLVGANRSGTQYMCMDGNELTDGPGDDASIQAMKSWGMNAVRVNGNEDCMLGINGAKLAGPAYQQALSAFIQRINAHGMYVIMDMHHSAPGGERADGQQQMADRDHAVSYWTTVANLFKNNPAVVFDLYNEPHPDTGNNTTDWQCIRDGNCPGMNFVSEGMQQMLNAVRQAGARNPVMVGGPQYAGVLDQWLQFKPNDPANQLAASVHIYGQPLGSPYDDPGTWDSQILPVAQQVPVVMGEIGDSDCTHNFIDKLMPWADSHGISYMGWSWVTSDCAGEPALITSYDGTPTNYGIGLRNHLQALPH